MENKKMKLIELYNQSRLKDWTEYDLYVRLNGVDVPVDKYSRDTECGKIVLHTGLPRPRKKKSE